MPQDIRLFPFRGRITDPEPATDPKCPHCGVDQCADRACDACACASCVARRARMSVADVAERERRIYAGGPKIEQVVRERARDARIVRNREKVEFALSTPDPVVPPGCVWNSFLSRVCERGTKSCEVTHET